MKRLVTIIIYMTAIFTMQSQPFDRKVVTDSLNRKLSAVKNSSDSIVVLSNLFDIAQDYGDPAADSIAQVIYKMALARNDKPLALEMLRQRSNFHLREVDVLERLLSEALIIENSNPALMKETSTFLRMALNNWFHLHAPEEQRRTRLEEELERWNMMPPTDLYERIVLLQSVCQSLTQDATGQLLKEYTDKLGQLINMLPPAQYSLRNQFNIQAALNYYNSGYPKEGLERDRHTLIVLDSLETAYKAKGRPYRNYDRYRFIIYTRALSNYESMTTAEIEGFYTKAFYYRNRSGLNLAPYDQLLEAYHAMARHDCAKAHPILKELLTMDLNRLQRMGVLRMAVKCAGQVGDQPMLINALSQLNEALQDALDTGVNHKIRELQIIYDINTKNRNIKDLTLERIKAQNDRKNYFIFFGAVLIAMLLGITIYAIFSSRRSRRLAKSLAASNAALLEESQRLMLTQGKLTVACDEARQLSQFKSDFIRTLGRELSEPLNAIVEYSRLIVDCSEAQGKHYLAEYADLVSSNSAFLTAVFNDIFRLSEGADEMPALMRAELTNINNLLRLAIETVKTSASAGVDIYMRPDSEDITAMVDPHRLTQIVLALLRNAVTHTVKGSVVVACGLTSNSERVAISVTDTGCGIDPTMASKVFERGVKGRKSSENAGLGLPIALMLAHLMGGDIVLDESYTAGARFVVTFPYKIIK